jgi:meiotically up-regulated gene 157 (Mug157) protein
MLIYFTEELSIEVEQKFKDVVLIGSQVQSEFSDKFYGEDLTTVYISLLCNSPRFEPFIKIRRPNYKSESRTFIDHGIEVKREGKSLSYDLKLNYELYANTEDIKILLAQDVLKSLDVINTVKKIKDFEFDKFKIDFELLFQRMGLI